MCFIAEHMDSVSTILSLFQSYVEWRMQCRKTNMFLYLTFYCLNTGQISHFYLPAMLWRVFSTSKTTLYLSAGDPRSLSSVAWKALWS